MEYIKCSNCKGTGRVPSIHGGGKYVGCQICGGTGKKAKKVTYGKGGDTNGYKQTKRSANQKH